MKVIQRSMGLFDTNVFILGNEETGEALIFDAPERGEKIYEYCLSEGFHPAAVILTHGHIDHIMGVPGLRRAAKERGEELPVYIAEKERELIEDCDKNLAMMFGFGNVTVKADRFFREGDVLNLAGFTFRVIETPGHTEGSCCFYFEAEKTLMSGDTLFDGSVGRTDFPGGSAAKLVSSIIDKLYKLPDDTVVYPGHFSETTIGREKKYNMAVPADFEPDL